jgi:hypothetical protein
MTVQPDDIVRITAEMYYTHGGIIQNVWHARQFTDTAPDTTFVTAACAKLDTIYDYWDEYMPDTCDFTVIRFFNVTQDSPMPTGTWPSLTSGGVDVADPITAVMGCLAIARTSQSRVIGRKWFAPFTEANHAGAQWSSGVTIGVSNGFNLWWAGWTSGNGSAVGVVYSPTYLTYFAPTSQAVSADPAFQRRRAVGRGA